MLYTPLDRILELEPGRFARAAKVTTRSDIGAPHWIVQAVLSGYPWSLAMEGAFQCAQVVLAPVMKERHHAILVRVDRAECARPLPFGVRLDYEVRTRRRNEQMAKMDAVLSVTGEPLARLEYTMGIVPAATDLVALGFSVYRDYLLEGWRGVASAGRHFAEAS